MLFTRTQRYHSSLPQDVFINRLIGKHVKIHDLDFEIIEKGNTLRIIPHAENIESIKTLPITNVALEHKGQETDVVVTSHMRALDSGGPQVIMAFCLFLMLASVILLFVDGQPQITYTLMGIGALIFAVFCVRLQMGYFDYVRKIHAYVKSRLEAQEMPRPGLN
ncbi:MAG: hypothetical protein JWQ38_3399 [Flavipsychrobacter sp.]|nr:hypothetical protein [Flavipsychrobacter sp.]